ncbi:MAG TPA: hypothetical protein VF013_03370 [Candidatus Limnocylindria bacterium]
MVSLVRADRVPLWSAALTRPLARLIPVSARPAALAAVKGIHTVAFFSIAGAILLFLADGLRGRPRRRSVIAMAVGLGESAVYVSNNQVCPLTPLAEELGAERGSVVDIYLPGWLNRRIPLLGGSALLLALAANGWALARNRHR